MKTVVLGGAGFVGRNLARILKQQKFNMNNVVFIDKDSENMKYVEQFVPNTVIANLATYGNWDNELKNADIVINLMAQISSKNKQDFIDNNITNTINLLKAMKKHCTKKTKIIHFSSAAVLSVRKDDYAKTKKKQEELITNSGYKYFTLRPSLMYGPTDTKNIGYLIRFAQKLPCFPIPGTGKYPRQPLYIDDVCMIAVKVIKRFPKKDEILSINGKETIFFKDMIKAVLKELGGFRFRVFLPVFVFKTLMIGYQGIIGNKQFTTDQVDSLTSGDVFPDYPWWDIFKIKPTLFRQGVKKMMPWFRKK